jgi:hypothetical protein
MVERKYLGLHPPDELFEQLRPYREALLKMAQAFRLENASEWAGISGVALRNARA